MEEAVANSDPYLAEIHKAWAHIRNLYMMFASRKPVMLYDLQEKKIYAHPYKEFRSEMNKRSQDILKRDYKFASTNRRMIIFVRDNEKRKLISYSMSIDPD